MQGQWEKFFGGGGHCATVLQAADSVQTTVQQDADTASASARRGERGEGREEKDGAHPGTSLVISAPKATARRSHASTTLQKEKHG